MGKDIRIKTEESVYHKYAADLKEALLRDDIATIFVYYDDKDKKPVEYRRVRQAVGHGLWILEEYPDGYYYATCSECDAWFDEDAFQNGWKYCPNCGAKMGEIDLNTNDK